MTTNKNIKQWQKLVYSIVNKFRNSTFKYKTYIDWQEMEQIGMIALNNALDRYDANKGSFTTYASTAIKRAILRQYYFDSKIEHHNDIDLYNNIQGDKENIINESYIEKSRLAKIIKSMTTSLRTKKIMLAYIAGYSMSEIAKEFNCSHQRISQIIYAQTDKLKKRLRNDNTIQSN